ITCNTVCYGKRKGCRVAERAVGNVGEQTSKERTRGESKEGTRARGNEQSAKRREKGLAVGQKGRRKVEQRAEKLEEGRGKARERERCPDDGKVENVFI
ncbi:hypothetical protein K0M31_012211, partial [Melipona bicolor]